METYLYPEDWEALGHAVMSAVAWTMNATLQRDSENFAEHVAKIEHACSLVGLEMKEGWADVDLSKDKA